MVKPVCKWGIRNGEFGRENKERALRTLAIERCPQLQNRPELCEKKTKTGLFAAKSTTAKPQVVGAEEVAVFHGTNYAKTARGCCRKIGGSSFQDAE